VIFASQLLTASRLCADVAHVPTKVVSEFYKSSEYSLKMKNLFRFGGWLTPSGTQDGGVLGNFCPKRRRR
jgi:hypothetical protein